MKKFFLLLLFAIFTSGLAWLVVVPIWHTPDEQAHFALVAYYAEKKTNPGGGIPDTTEEILISEQLLGTLRDNLGNNKFTFHPEYNIEYTNSLYGKYEATISALASTDSKVHLVRQEAVYYPLQYYIPASWIYRFFYYQDIFTRVIMVRAWSLILFLVNIFVVYKIGQLIFLRDKIKSFLLAILTGFHPMMVFSNIGVTSDVLGNLLFSIFLYSTVRVIIYGLDVKNFGFLILASFFALKVKTQFIIILPLLIVLITLLLLRDIKGKFKWIILGSITLLSVFILTHPYAIKFSALEFTANSIKHFELSSFLQYTKEYTVSHTIREVMPWYWGVYKWLGVTYPRFIHRIINRIVFISLAGFSIWFIHSILKRKWHSRQIQSIYFLLFSFGVYSFAISVYDWLSWKSSGFQLGVQGRYYFPFISVQMLCLMLGWQFLFPKKWGLKQKSMSLLGILMMILNVYALFFISSSYYTLLPFQKFIEQASQYKPYIVKGNFLILILGVYLLSVLIFTFQWLKFSLKFDKHKSN